jgi:glutathione synthase/RimK-type ligase-like ATP-grasp enzyme
MSVKISRGRGPASMRRYIYSKLAKTKAILVNPKVSKHVPRTIPMNLASLKQMLVKYKMVYIKPDIGTFGIGVMRVDWKEGAKIPYSYQCGLCLKRFVHYEEMFASISKDIKRKKRYLVQRGIHLLQHHGNPFDLRVMVQQTPKHTWETTGVIGRVAQPKKIVTNFHDGGTLKSVEALLSTYISADKKQPYIQKLEVLGLDVAGALHQKFKGLKEIGIDIAVDHNLKPWILEVNTAPDPYIFRHLKDKRIFTKIQQYALFNKRP